MALEVKMEEDFVVLDSEDVEEPVEIIEDQKDAKAPRIEKPNGSADTKLANGHIEEMTEATKNMEVAETGSIEATADTTDPPGPMVQLKTVVLENGKRKKPAPIPRDVYTSFYKVHKCLKKKPFKPIEIDVKCNGDKVRVLGCRKPSPEVTDLIEEIYKGMKCRVCRKFLTKHAMYVGADETGPLAAAGVTEQHHHPTYKKLAEAIEKCAIAEYIVIDIRTYGVAKFGGFDHFSVEVAAITEGTKFEVADYRYLFHQHAGTVVNLLIREGQDEHQALKSLDRFIDLLPKVTYGDKLAHSAKWFREEMSIWIKEGGNTATPAKQKLMAMRALCRTGLAKGLGRERMVVPNVKQVKDNTLDAMAKAKNEEELKHFLGERLSPQNYQRPTVEATTAQMSEAMKHFKDLDFKVDLMPLEHVTKYDGKVAIKQEAEAKASKKGMDDAVTAWDKMLQKKNKKPTASGFAARCDSASEKEKASHEEDDMDIELPTTMTGLLKDLDKYPGLEVETDNHTPVLATEYPDSAKEAMRYPHLWAFFNGYKISKYGTRFGIKTGFQQVSCLLRLGERSMFVGVRPTELPRDRKVLGNTCFPAFLSASYQRHCRRAFEQLNQVPMGVPDMPEETEWALGVGVSAGDADKNLVAGGITFRYRGKTFHIGKL